MTVYVPGVSVLSRGSIRLRIFCMSSIPITYFRHRHNAVGVSRGEARTPNEGKAAGATIARAPDIGNRIVALLLLRNSGYHQRESRL